MSSIDLFFPQLMKRGKRSAKPLEYVGLAWISS